jgi:hypothetical protein
MKGFSDSKKCKEPLFQVLLLDNDASLNVQVHEAPMVDYSTVKNHLKNGGSVFITSKKQQKLSPPKAGKAQQNYTVSRRRYGAIIQDTYGKQKIV